MSNTITQNTDRPSQPTVTGYLQNNDQAYWFGRTVERLWSAQQNRERLQNLISAAETAADWFSRSTRMDDLEQVEDLREAIRLAVNAQQTDTQSPSTKNKPEPQQ